MLPVNPPPSAWQLTDWNMASLYGECTLRS